MRRTSAKILCRDLATVDGLLKILMRKLENFLSVIPPLNFPSTHVYKHLVQKSTEENSRVKYSTVHHSKVQYSTV
jgi:hypothetical protein